MGKRSFIAALINQFVYLGGVTVRGESISLVNIDRQHKHADRTSYMLSAREALNGMHLSNTFSGNYENFIDQLEFEVCTRDREAGFVRFCNISGGFKHSCKLLGDDSVQTVIVFISAEDILNGNGEIRCKQLMQQLQTLSKRQPENIPMNILFTISKADLIGVDKTQSYSFFSENCRFCSDMIKYCTANNYRYFFAAFSVVGSHPENVFSSDGGVLPNPEFEPWNISAIGLYCIDSALTSYRNQLYMQYNDSLKLIKRNRGIFHKGSVKAAMTVDYNRELLSSVLLNIYDVDVFSESHASIVEYLKEKMFYNNGGYL